MKRSIKQQVELEKTRKAKNPGKANREARKAERGETFVGYRPARFIDKKTKSRNRNKVKSETNKIINEY